MTEPGTGSDLAGMKTTAKLSADGTHYVLNGAKTFITGGVHADRVIVCARTAPPKPDDRRYGISLLVVDTKSDGYTVGRKLDKLGLRTSDTAELSFTDVKVPVEDLLGEENKGFGYLGQNLPQERLGIAIGAYAQAKAAVRFAQQYVAERTVFGKPVAAFQNTKFELAACKSDVDALEAVVDRALEAHDDGELTAAEAAVDQAVLHRDRRPGHRPLPATARRLRLHQRVPDRPPVRRQPCHAYLRRHQRGDEDDHRQGHGSVISQIPSAKEKKMRYAVDHITATGAALEDTARALSAAGMSAARTLPFAGRVFGAAPRLELAGRVVFVTGAARGIGAEVARQAHARGARVALVGRRLEPLQQLAAQLGEGAAAFQADVRDLDALQRAADATVARFGGIDVVIANAGIAPPSEPILTIDPGEFERTVDIDLLGQWRTVRATLPAVIERRGHILVVASIYAFVNGTLNASYAASKAGVDQLTRALRVEIAHHGATAGVAYLGFVDTDLVGDVFAQQQIVEARSIMPAFATRPIPVTKAGRTLVDGIESRAATVAAPGWIRPLLPLRGIAGTLMDEFMLANPGLSRAISRAERKPNEQ